MLIYAGIDEAGYGPMLGPLTVACAVFEVREWREGDAQPDLWEVLGNVVSREIKGARQRVVVADSKKLKLSKEGKRHPLTHLERGVLSFAMGAGEGYACATEAGFLEGLCEGAVGRIGEVAWYGGRGMCEEGAIPVAQGRDEIALTAHVLRRGMERAGVGFAGLRLEMLLEGEFNAMVGRVGNKSAASFALVGRHLLNLWRAHGAKHPRVIVDRQGGRMFYRQELQVIFGEEGAIRIVAETPRMSRYEIASAEGQEELRRMTVTFTEEAESAHLPVALASMTAKYVRELMMLRFNRFFAGLKPEIRPTAGYVEDGRRFMSEVEGLLAGAGITRASLVRCC